MGFGEGGSEAGGEDEGWAAAAVGWFEGDLDEMEEFGGGGADVEVAVWRSGGLRVSNGEWPRRASSDPMDIL